MTLPSDLMGWVMCAALVCLCVFMGVASLLMWKEFRDR